MVHEMRRRHTQERHLVRQRAFLLLLRASKGREEEKALTNSRKSRKRTAFGKAGQRVFPRAFAPGGAFLAQAQARHIY
jgi:hypothetical protein